MAQLARDEEEIKATQLVRNTLLALQSFGEPHSLLFCITPADTHLTPVAVFLVSSWHHPLFQLPWR